MIVNKNQSLDSAEGKLRHNLCGVNNHIKSDFYTYIIMTYFIHLYILLY
jgi:hypothetical protein